VWETRVNDNLKTSREFGKKIVSEIAILEWESIHNMSNSRI